MALPPSLHDLHEILDLYLKAIARQKEPNPPALRPLVLQLETLSQALISIAPAQLRHYLEKKSYRKAWDYLARESSPTLLSKKS